MAKLQWHKLKASMFPKDTQDLITKRANIVKQLEAATLAVEKSVGAFAGRIQVPVMVDTGELTRYGNKKFKADPTGKVETLPRQGEVLIIGWRFGFAVASGSAKDAADNAKTEAVLI